MTVAGWLPDPTNRHELRWWDGAQWTDRVSDKGVEGTHGYTPDLVAVPAPPAKKSGRGWLGLGLFLLVVVALLSYFARDDTDPTTQRTSDSGLYNFHETARFVEVLYEVDGSATTADLTLELPSGTSQQNGVGVPVTTESGKHGLTAKFPRGSFVYLSAQNGGDTGTITCRITVDGIVISENTSSGAYAIAACDGTA